MAHSPSASAPLYIIETAPSEDTESFGKGVTSYFDISPNRDGSPATRSPASPPDISPGSQPQRPPVRRPHFRFHSDFEALHKRIHGHIIAETQSLETLTSPGRSSTPSQEIPSAKITPGRSTEQSPRRASLQTSGSSERSSVAVRSPSPRENLRYPPRQSKVGQLRATSSSLTSRVGKWTAANEIAQRRSSTLSESITRDGNIIVVRTDQAPMRPPPSKSAPVSKVPKASSIKVETEFTESGKQPGVTHGVQTPQPTINEEAQPPGQTTRSPDHDRRQSRSRRSSINPKQIFSAPLRLLRRVSLSKRTSSPAVAQRSPPSSTTRNTRLADHTTQLKRNYTSDVLQRVSATLQEIKTTTPATLFPPQIARPLTWKTFSDKSIPQKAKKGQRNAHGLVSSLDHSSNNHNSGSGDHGSDVKSYTSSQRYLRMGTMPTNTPDEKATYKIKRSPSAETEEFLEVDISVRGGTNYLPSEARRIHTPPLPEEGADGRWKGFFFDYNAPRRASSLQAPEIVVEDVANSGSGSPDSVLSADLERHKLIPEGRPKLERSRTKNKRILTSEWADVQLAEIDLLGTETKQDDMQSAKEGSRRLNSPDVLSRNRTRIMYEGKEVEPEMFDLTIPEHLPSSPLCPRHPRYWRVWKRQGSQFRGCWMHGIGVYEGTNSKA
ncbi:hypothetical protein CLCR_08193 [Cladophialophora carrionii]|uniref:Uncharacterized protein n=1 Tax=Cladophialophora carrionii TaxID=86049 RepID=A0A1C1CR52_9EURO|nr:hypothetical protein CLCR_08193 [Cladophialophora carrionii]